jgi:glycosyltransferase involved in cell wall biosynthesis
MVSVIMPTADRRSFLPAALKCFLSQDWPERELIVVDDGTDPVHDLIPAAGGRFRYIRCGGRRTVGEKRNIACREARGEFIAHFDDDDWSAPHRLRLQVEALKHGGAEVCGTDRPLYFDIVNRRALRYVYPRNLRPWVSGNSLCYRRSLWEKNPFPNLDVGEDARFLWRVAPSAVLRLEGDFLVATAHARNVSPKDLHGARWKPEPLEIVRALIGPLMDELTSAVGASNCGRVLVAAARGVGDILRVTPLVSALGRMGYRVDMLLEPDYPETVQLLDGAPQVGRIFWRQSAWRGSPVSKPLEPDAVYDLAVFTALARHLRRGVKASRVIEFNPREWMKTGDPGETARIARQLGWQDEMPPPFAQASDRRFNLPEGTVAFHPGSKPDWKWKRWKGFASLALRFPSVAVLGSEDDRDDGEWPPHAIDFRGKLSLPDTAALMRECRALVSNDSGLMHLGVAMGIPVFGIFGITSPQREALPASNMFPITGGLDCEPRCRNQPWGRRDCDRHLECLETLQPESVARIAQKKLGLKIVGERAMTDLTLTYYGNVFDASGYGNAARCYLHALHEAGLRLKVVDLGAGGRQVSDPLVESLINGSDRRADFHLFHGIPAVWAREAFKLPNAIGMTVWETESIPTQWRNPLNHTVEVWLPSRYNVEIFKPALTAPVFHLPHPAQRARTGAIPPFEGAGSNDYVFYSIFEWQDRKSPHELLEAYCRAFADEGAPILIVKTNLGAADAARHALDSARLRTGSRARVAVYAEGWSEEQVESLTARGDCYLSLHRSEGWGYPLFEAACRGKAIVATAYSGPMDYLSPEAHHLVPWEKCPVEQRYVFYSPRMRWARPDVEKAAQAIHEVYTNRDDAAARSRREAVRLKERYAPERIASVAISRLEEIRERRRGRVLRVLPAAAAPPVPIPAEWFDADYFDGGRKSNWRGGYTWPGFVGLFRETAGFLREMFPQASSLLDAGCAKGFLVRAVREAQLDAEGFDLSPYAIGHAEPCVKSHLRLGSADSIEYERQFDILAAFDLLQCLTEEQARAFLRRSRAWTRQALVAVIPTAAGTGNRDLSHVTIRPREWWRERMLEAGWKQDAVHASFEAACRRHRLPVRMKWELFVYAA